MKYIRQKLIGIGYIALALIVGKLIGEWGCLAYAVPLGLWLLLSRKPVLDIYCTEQPPNSLAEHTERQSA
ncbi:MAG: hypothetical protein ACI38A_05240 [Candidatus Ornithomonoglobus sp.]